MQNLRLKWAMALLLLLPTVAATAQHPPEVSIIHNGYIFSEAPFKQCHASTLVQTANGNLLAAWFGGAHEGATDVAIWASIRQNGQWGAPFKVAGSHSDGKAVPCWNPVLFAPDDTTLLLYFKKGPSPREWESMVTRSTDNGLHWSPPVALTGYSGPVKNKPIVTPAGSWLNPASTETTKRWQLFIERSDNKGKNWSIVPVDTANQAKVIQPTLMVLPAGRIVALSRSNQNVVMESWSDDDGRSWSLLQPTTLPNPNSGIDAVTLRSGEQLLVYNPGVSGKDWWNGRNCLRVALSIDGKKWMDVAQLEEQPEGEFSYPAVIQSTDGTVHITYTHNRTKIKYIALKVN